MSRAEAKGSDAVAAEKAWGGLVQGREERHRLKRRAILVAAARTIRQKSYSEMTLADVADDLHISKPTLYYYFESKEQILFEIQRLAIAMLNESGPLDGERDALAEGRASDRLARFIARYVKMITSDFGACLIMTPRQVYEPQTRKRLIEAIRPTDTLVMRILEEGVRQGEFRIPDLRLATNFLFGTLNWFPFWYRASGRANVEEIAAAATNFVISALRQGESQSPRTA